MAEKLTPQQEMAVLNRGGELLVSAAAGSGKTKVLVDRLMQYMLDPVQPANLDDFLIITYTKAAASELRAKIAAKLSEYIARSPENRHLQHQMQRLYLAKISTVHSFCADLLKEYAYALDIPVDFRVADEFECTELQNRTMVQLLDDAYEHIADDPQFKALVDGQGLGRNDNQIPEIVLKVYNAAQCHLDPNGWLDWCLSVSDVSQIHDAAQTVWGRYLIDDLRQYLKLQIAALEGCLALMSNANGMEKQSALLRSTVDQLTYLAECDSWDGIYNNRMIDYGRLVFSSKCDDPALAEQIKAVRDACKKGVAKKLRYFADASANVLEDIQSTAEATKGLVCFVKRFADEYKKIKRKRHVLDFGDLEHLTLNLLMGKNRSAPTGLAHEIGARFREIMVDEYQDSNVVQDTVFYALSSEKHNCFMVGDVKQSIYQFRLADPDIFLKKYNRYQYAESAMAGEGRKVMLSCNFRSSAGVISAVNDVFELCMSPEIGGLHYGEGEKLVEGLAHTPLGEPEVELYGLQAQGDSYTEEASYTAQRIGRLLDGTHFVRDGDNLRPILPEDIVILLRSPGSIGHHYKLALERMGIRCASGGGGDLLHSEEIEVLHAFLQIIINPLQDIPLITILCSRVFGVTADELAGMRSASNHSMIYYSVLSSTLPKVKGFVQLLALLREESKWLSVSQLLNKILSMTRIDSIYSALKDGEGHAENIQTFLKLAVSYESNTAGDLCGFLEHLAALDEKGGVPVEQSAEKNAVTIMSIHKSKGLEFPVVFLCGLSREFNMESMRAPVLCDKTLGLGLNCVDTRNRVRYPSVAKHAIACAMRAQSISEELRVLYVAMTRARDRLIMMYTATNLEGQLSAIADRMEISNSLLMTGDVDCPGKWILYAALHRQESNAFYSLIGKRTGSAVSSHKWLVEVVQNVAIPDAVKQDDVDTATNRLTSETLRRIRDGLSFSYPNEQATRAPSKQTATQLKGRDKDREAEENTIVKRNITHDWKKPSFVSDDAPGTVRGNAVHKVMQYLNYHACADIHGVQMEIARLVKDNYISDQQAQMVDPNQIAALFQTELGQELIKHNHVIREFKFSVMEDGAKYYSGMDNERILLQGVIDCAMIDSDGITIIDFKTDRVTDKSIDVVSQEYRVQLETYSNALSRIYETPIKGAFLYFFEKNTFVKIV